MQNPRILGLPDTTLEQDYPITYKAVVQAREARNRKREAEKALRTVWPDYVAKEFKDQGLPTSDAMAKAMVTFAKKNKTWTQAMNQLNRAIAHRVSGTGGKGTRYTPQLATADFVKARDEAGLSNMTSADVAKFTKDAKMPFNNALQVYGLGPGNRPRKLPGQPGFVNTAGTPSTPPGAKGSLVRARGPPSALGTPEDLRRRSEGLAAMMKGDSPRVAGGYGGTPTMYGGAHPYPEMDAGGLGGGAWRSRDRLLEERAFAQKLPLHLFPNFPLWPASPSMRGARIAYAVGHNN